MRVAYTLSAAACLSLVASLPSPQRKPIGPDDHTVLNMTKIYSDDTILKDVNKGCDDPLVSNANQFPKKIWDGLGCYYLFHALQDDWAQKEENGGAP